MRMPRVHISLPAAAVVVSLSVAACGGGGESRSNAPAATAAAAATQEQAPSSAPAVDVPDACTFIARSDLEAIVGRELRDGKRRTMPPGETQCDFQTPPDFYVTRRFESPALPDASGFSSITITTNPATPATFEESRKLMGDGAPPLTGVGDAAFFGTQAMIYVRVANRGFSIRVHVNAPTTDNGRTRLREVMLGLARAGVAKL